MPLPPSPRSPAAVQTLQFFRDPFTLLSECKERHGDIFTLKLLGMGNWVFLTSPDLMREMFKAPAEDLVTGEVNGATLGFLMGLDAVFSLDGKQHLKRRRMVLPYFTGKSVKRRIGMMDDVAKMGMDEWPHGSPFPFLRFAHLASLRIMVKTFFEASPKAVQEEMIELFDVFSLKGLRSPLILLSFLQINLGKHSPWGKILAMRDAVGALVAQEIDRRIADPEAFGDRDVASSMVRAMVAGEIDVTRQGLIDEIFNDIFAGHETTGGVLTWTVECVLRRPELLEQLRQEIDEVLGDQPVTEETIGQLPITDAIIAEAVRYRPLAPQAGFRLVKNTYEIGGYTLPPGTTLAHGFSVLARNGEVFDNAEDFDICHFHQRRVKHFDWSPFGGGTRMCLGKGLAEIELAVLLPTIFQHFDLELAQNKVYPVRHGMFFGPNEGLKVRATPRTPVARRAPEPSAESVGAAPPARCPVSH
ncbi:MAG: cytochrome P450 [Acidobacteriota bacterium]